MAPLTFGAAGGGAAGGAPEVDPLAAMLSALSTLVAARFRFPEERIPASPASITPDGAIRFTLPGSTPATVARTPIPPPVPRPARSVCTFPLWGSIKTCVGAADWTVLAEDPAAMFPLSDQIRISPPRRVKIRLMPMEISSRE